MTTKTREPQDEGILVRRMRHARLRQWAVAGLSVLLTALGVVLLSPKEIGSFAYYTLLVLMLLNATIALRQGMLVIFPIETLLRKIRRVERGIDEGCLDTGRFSIKAGDAFACLTAGLDTLVAKLSEKARASTERALQNAAMLRASPFTIFTVSSTGKVYEVVKDGFELVPLLGIKVGDEPSEETWGRQNRTKYLGEVKTAFDSGDLRWFDLDVGTHHLRGSVKRLNTLTAIVYLGDLPAIDQTVASMAGSASESDFTHRRNSLKRMAASLAHDGRNIFAALGNLVAVNRASTDPNVRDQIPIAEDAIRRGTALMTELATFAGEAHLNLACVSAADGLRAIIESPALKALVPSNIRLLCSISEQKMPQIDLDADQIWKVAANLLKNAAEALAGRDGRVWMKAEPILMTEETARSFQHTGKLRVGEGVLLTFADDGPGIATEMIGRLFEPYYSSKGEGRGIGLATVMTIVDGHGGAISVKSSPGYGTTFYIYLPASRHTAEELKMMHEIAPNGEILLIDDDPTILHTTGLVLRSLKIAAHPAATEEDAIAKLRALRERLKAVLVDGSLRCVNTAGLVRHIHAGYPDLPVVVVSGSPEETISRRFAGVPYDRFLSKPYSVAELSQALKAVMNSKIDEVKN